MFYFLYNKFGGRNLFDYFWKGRNKQTKKEYMCASSDLQFPGIW